LSKLLQ